MMRSPTSRDLAGMAALGAVAAILEIPPLDLSVPILGLRGPGLDPAGIPIALAGILYGPFAAVLTTSIGGLVIASRDPISASFKFVAEVSTAVPLALILWGFRRRIGANPRGAWILMGIFGSVAIAARIAVMTGYLYVFLPILLGVPLELVVSSLPLFAIFNAAQGVINVVPAYFILRGLPPDLKPSWLAFGEG